MFDRNKIPKLDNKSKTLIPVRESQIKEKFMTATNAVVDYLQNGQAASTKLARTANLVQKNLDTNYIKNDNVVSMLVETLTELKEGPVKLASGITLEAVSTVSNHTASRIKWKLTKGEEHIIVSTHLLTRLYRAYASVHKLINVLFSENKTSIIETPYGYFQYRMSGTNPATLVMLRIKREYPNAIKINQGSPNAWARVNSILLIIQLMLIDEY